jgi:hypothetical protein
VYRLGGSQTSRGVFASQVIQGRWPGVEDLEALQRLIAEHPHWSRRRLSIALCEALNWRTAILRALSEPELFSLITDAGELIEGPLRALNRWKSSLSSRALLKPTPSFVIWRSITSVKILLQSKLSEDVRNLTPTMALANKE